MAHSNETIKLARARSIAQYFTITAAVLGGISWFITSVLSNRSSDNINPITGILAGATAIGGVVMGLLYLVYLQRKK